MSRVIVMKKTSLFIVALCAFAFSAGLQAQPAEPIGPKAKDWGGRYMVSVKKALKIDDETAEKIRVIYNRRQDEKRAAFAAEKKNLKRELTAAEAAKIGNPIDNKHNAKIRELLTPAQQRTFDNGFGKKLPE
jgi:Spy/CpxP family protein refolding chaperone